MTGWSPEKKLSKTAKAQTTPLNRSTKESSMNPQKVEGKFDQVAGKIKQSVGEAIGSQKLANAGAAEQIKGAAKETWGKAKDAAEAVREQNRSRASAKGENLKAHEVRGKVTVTAQNIKNKVSEKLDNMKREHRG
jgi:uncharacterized protein YjbJ (UPF0337 family)